MSYTRLCGLRDLLGSDLGGFVAGGFDGEGFLLRGEFVDTPHSHSKQWRTLQDRGRQRAPTCLLHSHGPVYNVHKTTGATRHDLAAAATVIKLITGNDRNRISITMRFVMHAKCGHAHYHKNTNGKQTLILYLRVKARSLTDMNNDLLTTYTLTLTSDRPDQTTH